MREPVCSVIYPLRHGAENRKGRLIESSPNPSPNKLNKVRGLDEIVPLTVGPAVSALEAITSWLCFCDPASGLWKTAGSQLLLPRAGRGAGGCSLWDRQWGGRFRHIVHASKTLHFLLLWCYLGKHEPFRGRDDTVETICNIFQVTFPSPTILKNLIIFYWHLPCSTVKLLENRAEKKGR